MKLTVRSAAGWVFRLVLGGMLLYAGLLKLGHSAGLAAEIANYLLLPAQGNQILAVLLPWWEIVAGLLLVLGLWVRPAALVAGGLFLAFAVAVSTALVRGLDIECGCFGTGAAQPLGFKTLAIDLAGLTLALALLWLIPPQQPKTA